ncbi:uncharacterized protein [Atheta coriaria]|uniref:uncharacterized protein n=1 Tax=Dalotia coriaria TaxID=877792 RepID=UPI0031F3BB25
MRTLYHHYALLTFTCLFYATIDSAVGGPWASPSQELLDELHDAEIYRAVVQSMNEWQSKHNQLKHRRKRDEPSVCYPELGCFEASGPFGYLDMLPSKPEEISTRFLLYPSHSSRRNGNTVGEFPFTNISDAFTWAKTGLNNTLPLKVMIHGFGSDCSHIWVYEMRSALMAVDDLNVICVDWGNGATLPNYVKAAANTRLVGKQLGMLLSGMVDKVGFSVRNIHLVGFSLGAHVAGFAGAELGNLSRITGLDPAGPLFESQDPRARLDQTDATFVDVIHSNGENLILGGLGSWQPMGHVDFYPNGGRMQKGCSNIFVGAVSDIIWSSAVEGRSLCNHRRAYKFFTDSVSPRCHFPAFPCESYDDFLAGNCFPCTDERKCGNMGYYADRSKGRGQLYLITRDEEPFCAHQYNIKIESTPGDVPIISYGKIQITLIGDSLLNETFTLTRKEDEEMRLGSMVSRIIVPHPILLEPTKIQILYNAYSGWLTSGLLQWRIDKITLSDSFGRSASVCNKGLILDSGIPVVLPLYPGECNLPNSPNTPHLGSNPNEEDDIYKAKNSSKFVPTPVVKSGSEVEREGTSSSSEDLDKKESQNTQIFRDAFDIFNIPWNNDNNLVDNESEQSRAFNSRVVKVTRNNGSHSQEDNIPREVVEPILKPQSKNKIGRSSSGEAGHHHEITEPILGPTTVKPILTTHRDEISTPTRPRHRPRGQKHNRELVYNFYDVDAPLIQTRTDDNGNNNRHQQNDWIPTIPINENKWKRHDDSTGGSGGARVYNYNGEREEQDAFNAIVRTVQFLPQRLARMFEEAEKYARETILPLVSTYTPKFISDFIVPNVPNATPKYLPLRFEESTEDGALTTAQLFKNDKESKNASKIETFDPPPIDNTNNTKLKRNTLSDEVTTPISPTTTPQTYIQKVAKRGDEQNEVASEATTTFWDFQNLDSNSEQFDNLESFNIGHAQARSDDVSKPVSTTTSTTSTTTTTTKKPPIIKLSTPMTIPISDVLIASSGTTPPPRKIKTTPPPITKLTVNTPTTTPPSGKKDIFIDLPVIDEKYKEVKYIPLSDDKSTSIKKASKR